MPFFDIKRFHGVAGDDNTTMRPVRYGPVALNLAHEGRAWRSAGRQNTGPAPLALVLLALLLCTTPLAGEAATIYRWVDQQGKTHYSEQVPEQFRQTAKPLSAAVSNPTEAQLREAQERAGQEMQRASEIGSAATAQRPAPQARSASSTPLAKRPARAPDERTDCATWARLYQESLSCFGPYRTTRGATRVEAFSHCTPVDEPPIRCRQRLPD